MKLNFCYGFKERKKAHKTLMHYLKRRNCLWLERKTFVGAINVSHSSTNGAHLRLIYTKWMNTWFVYAKTAIRHANFEKHIKLSKNWGIFWMCIWIASGKQLSYVREVWVYDKWVNNEGLLGLKNAKIQLNHHTSKKTGEEISRLLYNANQVFWIGVIVMVEGRKHLLLLNQQWLA